MNQPEVHWSNAPVIELSEQAREETAVVYGVQNIDGELEPTLIVSRSMDGSIRVDFEFDYDTAIPLSFVAPTCDIQKRPNASHESK